MHVERPGEAAGPGHPGNLGQELVGHRDVKTTMIYTHVLNGGPAGVHSPADVLWEEGFYADPHETP